MNSDQPDAQSALHGGEVGDDEGVVAADGYAFVVRLPKSASAVRLWAEPVLRPATNMLAATPGQIRRRASPGANAVTSLYAGSTGRRRTPARSPDRRSAGRSEGSAVRPRSVSFTNTFTNQGKKAPSRTGRGL